MSRLCILNGYPDYFGRKCVIMKALNNNLPLVQLLPQSPQTLIANNKQGMDLLVLYQYFLEQSIQVFEYILNDEWWAFDPQVGENQCQIRAYQIFLLSQNLREEKKEIRTKYKEAKSLYIDLIILKNQYNNDKKNYFSPKITLDTFLMNKNLVFIIHEPFFYLIQCRFLTIFGEKDANDMYMSMNYDKIGRELNISKTISRKIVHKFQSYVSKKSCEFVLFLLNRMNGLMRLKGVISLLYQHDEEGRAVLPLYFTTLILMQDFIENSGSLIIDVKDSWSNHKKYYFRVMNNKFFYGSAIDSSETENCIVLKSKTHLDLIQKEAFFIQSISNHFKLILLSNEAAHPQYPGKRLQNKKSNPFHKLVIDDVKLLTKIQHLNCHFIKMQKMAEILGCSQSNPSLLFIEHIFCSTLKKEMSRNIEHVPFLKQL